MVSSARLLKNQRHLDVGHDLDRGQAGRADHLGDVLGDLLAAFDDDLAGLFAAGRIDDVVDRDLAFDLADAAAVDDFFVSRSRRTRGSARHSRLYLGSMARSSVIAENLPLWSMRTLSVSFLLVFSSIQLPRSGMMRQLCSGGRRLPSR